MKGQNRREFLKRTGLVTGVSLLAGAGVSWGQGSEAKSGNVGIAKPSRLRCEYLDDPESIDFAPPGLSWEVMTDDQVARAVDQTAYQVFAASSLYWINVNRGTSGIVAGLNRAEQSALLTVEPLLGAARAAIGRSEFGTNTGMSQSGLKPLISRWDFPKPTYRM